MIRDRLSKVKERILLPVWWLQTQLTENGFCGWLAMYKFHLMYMNQESQKSSNLTKKNSLVETQGRT